MARSEAATDAMKKSLDTLAAKKVTPKVTATTNKPVVDAMQKAIGQIKSKTVSVTANLRGNLADQLASQLRNVKVGPGFKLPGRQHGYHGTIRRPTLMMIGEGGRQEDIDITPRGSIQRSRAAAAAGGGFHGCVNVYIGGERIMSGIRYQISDNQATFK